MDSLDILTYDLTARTIIRDKNQSSKQLKDKYFNEIFNLKNFAIKIINKFVVSATWRWIGSSHKAHIIAFKICKILVEYQLFTLEEFNDVIRELYLKVLSMKGLEKAIEKDSNAIEINIVKAWRIGFQQIRDYYSEIVIQFIVYSLDSDLYRLLQGI